MTCVSSAKRFTEEVFNQMGKEMKLDNLQNK